MAQTLKLKRSAVSGNAPSTGDLALGEIAINTYDGKIFIKKDDGTESIVTFEAGGSSNAGTIEEDSFSGNGSTTAFTLTTAPSSEENLLVFIDATFQNRDSFTISGTTITFDTAPDNGTSVRVYHVIPGTLDDGILTVAKFAADTLVTEAEGISSNDNDTTIPTSAAVKDYVDTQVATVDTLPEVLANGNTTGGTDISVSTGDDITFADSSKAIFGASSDLQIYHDGSHSFITDSGTGNLRLQGTNLALQNAAGTKNYFLGSDGGAATLYHNNTSVLSTTADGISVTSEVEADEFIGDLRGAVLFKAQAGENVTKGDVVYISGISGNTTVVSKADADDASKMPAFGIVATTTTSGQPVDIYTQGILGDLDTSAYSEGDELFVSTTAGALTNTPPTGETAAIQKIAKVTRSNNLSGSIFITGAGRSNATPNLDEDQFFLGNASNQSVATDFSDAVEALSINNVVEDTTPQLGGDLASNGNDILFADNDKAIFGAGSDLQIYHDGSHSRLKEVGTGNFYFDVSNSLFVRRNDTSALMASFETGVARLYYDNALKLATTSTGIDVTGTATMDGLTVDNGGSGLNYLQVTNSEGSSRFGTDGGFARILDGSNNLSYASDGVNQYFYTDSSTLRMKLATGGDISFYEDTGTTAKFFWDASAERLGIGTSSPSSLLHLNSSGGHAITSTFTGQETFEFQHGTSGFYAKKDNVFLMGLTQNHDLTFYNTSGTEYARFDGSSESLGIGTTSPSSKLHIEGSAPEFRIYSDNTTGGNINFIDQTWQSQIQGTAGSLLFKTGGTTTALTINSSQNATFAGTISSGAITSTGEVEATALDINGNGDISGNLTLGGYLAGPATFTIDPAAVGDNTGTVVIAGNLQVDGTTTTINSTTLTVDDKLITLASGSANAAAANGAGIEVEISGATNPSLTYDGTNDEWDFNKPIVSSRVNTNTVNNVGNTANIIYRSSTNTIVGNNASALVVQDGGNVGIGTSSPNHKLDVYSSERFPLRVHRTSSDLSNTQGVGIGLSLRGDTATSTSDTRAAIMSQYNGDFYIAVDSGGNLNTTDPIDEAALFIEGSNKYVGIGTTTPDSKLTVNTATTGDGIELQSSEVSIAKLSRHLVGSTVVASLDGVAGRPIHIGGAVNEKVILANAGGNVGIGSTAPAAKLQVEEYGIDTTETSTNATTQTVIHTMSASDFRSARFTVQVTNSTDSTYHLTEILMIHDGTTPSITEYGTIFTGSAEATFDADISSGNVRLLATPASTDTMEFKVVAHSITT
jgi:hypothetical protein